MMQKLVRFMNVRKALKVALKEYDKETILDIIENELDGWGNGTEILNGIEYMEVKQVLSTI